MLSASDLCFYPFTGQLTAHHCPAVLHSSITIMFLWKKDFRGGFTYHNNLPVKINETTKM